MINWDHKSINIKWNYAVLDYNFNILTLARTVDYDVIHIDWTIL